MRFCTSITIEKDRNARLRPPQLPSISAPSHFPSRRALSRCCRTRWCVALAPCKCPCGLPSPPPRPSWSLPSSARVLTFSPVTRCLRVLSQAARPAAVRTTSPRRRRCAGSGWSTPPVVGATGGHLRRVRRPLRHQVPRRRREAAKRGCQQQRQMLAGSGRSTSAWVPWARGRALCSSGTGCRARDRRASRGASAAARAELAARAGASAVLYYVGDPSDKVRGVG